MGLRKRLAVENKSDFGTPVHRNVLSVEENIDVNI